MEANNIKLTTKPLVASYYKWYGDKAYDDFGYFVSLVPGTAEIKICDGTNIFGVAVDPDLVGVVVGQTNEPNNNLYGIVSTDGAVEVRCGAEIEVGDYVVSGKDGVAVKTTTNSGYQVTALSNKNGVLYAIISLGVQACTTDYLDANIQHIDSRLDAAENNIVSAMNLAAQAYNQATQDRVASEGTLREDIDKIGNQITDINKDLDEANKVIQSTNETAKSAEALVKGVVTDATTKCTEIVDAATEEWAATANQIKTEARSLVAKIDTHTVGEYSQSNGLTLLQAQNIMRKGMIYVPTMQHTETYEYTNDAEHIESWNAEDKDNVKIYYDTSTKLYWYHDGTDWKSIEAYVREFTPGFLYLWDKWSDESFYKWVTIDWRYDGTPQTSVTAAESVWFSPTPPDVATDSQYQYWYADIEDGLPEGYQVDTLYHWESDHWVAVATLLGNVSNRMMCDVYQTTNKHTISIANARQSIAEISQEVSDTKSSIDAVSKWVKGSDEDGNPIYNLSAIRQETDDGGAYLALVVADVDGNRVVDGATIAMSSTGEGSEIKLDADKINFDVEDFTLDALKINFTAEEFKLNADKINFGTEENPVDFEIAANKIDFSSYSFEFKDEEEEVLLSAGNKTVTIGGWDVTKDLICVDDSIAGEDSLYKNIGLYSGDQHSEMSLQDSTQTTPIRLYTGQLDTDRPSTMLRRFVWNNQNEGSDFWYEGTTYTHTIEADDGYKIEDVELKTTKVATWTGLHGSGSTNDISGDAQQASGSITLKLQHDDLPEGTTVENIRFDIVEVTFMGIESATGNDVWFSGTGYSIESASLDEVTIHAYADDVPYTLERIYAMEVSVWGECIYGANIDVYTTHSEKDIQVAFTPKFTDSFNIIVDYTMRKVDRTFTLTADGSMYVDNIQCNGSFVSPYGYIYAHRGDIGRLSLSDRSINDMLYFGDDYISTETAQIDSIAVKNIRADINDNQPYLVFESVLDNSVDTITVKAKYNLIQRGQWYEPFYRGNSGEVMDVGADAYISTFGEVQIVLSVDKEFAEPTKIPLTLIYDCLTANEDRQRTQDISVIFPSGTLIHTITRNHLIISNKSEIIHGTDYSVKNARRAYGLSGVSLRQSTFKQSLPTETYKKLMLTNADVIPQENGLCLGDTNNMWDSVYAQTNYCIDGAVRIDGYGEDFIKLNNTYSTLFDNLKPCTFMSIKDKKRHIGLDASEVASAITSAGLSSKDVAAYCSWSDDDGTHTGIKYDEFIALNIYETQNLKNKATELQRTIESLSDRLDALEALIGDANE